MYFCSWCGRRRHAWNVSLVFRVDLLILCRPDCETMWVLWMQFKPNKGYRCEYAIIVGGSLAGSLVCSTVVENSNLFLFVDRSLFCASTVAKATGGINGRHHKARKQKELRRAMDFTIVMLKSGAEKFGLVKVHCENNGADVGGLKQMIFCDSIVAMCLIRDRSKNTNRAFITTRVVYHCII